MKHCNNAFALRVFFLSLRALCKKGYKKLLPLLLSVFLSHSYSQILPFKCSEFNSSPNKNQGRKEKKNVWVSWPGFSRLTQRFEMSLDVYCQCHSYYSLGWKRLVEQLLKNIFLPILIPIINTPIVIRVFILVLLKYVFWTKTLYMDYEKI